MKDAKGHGSDSRGGGSALSRDDLAKQVAFTKAAGKDMTEAQKAWVMAAEDRLNYGKGEPRVGGPGMKGAAMGSVASGYWSAKSLANVGGGQPVASNAHAAATLASGPKSAPVPAHPGTDGPRNAQGYRTTGTAYEGPREVPMQSRRDRAAEHNAGPNGLVRSNKPYRGIGS